MTALPREWIAPEWSAPASVRAFVTTRAGGVSQGPYAAFNLATRVGDDPAAVGRNREILRSHLPADVVWLHQVHGAEVVDAAAAGSLPRADGAVARTRRTVCGVLTADCLPVLLAARDGSVVGVAHAGWRGMAAGVIEATLARMAVRSESIVAWLGPCIGPGAYEVGREVHDAFVAASASAAQAFAPRGHGKFLADLYQLARQRLAASGVHDVLGGGFCTYTDADRFYSYRRERTTGRFATLVWID